jgi:anaerobic glycerol-3-phosphate dehydrogenase
VGLYETVTAFNVSIPAANYSAAASAGTRRGEIEILDNEDGVRDRYVVDMSAPDQNVSGPAVAGMTLERLAIVLRDRTTLAVSSDALPAIPPLLSDFAFGHELFMGFAGPMGSIELGATLTSLTTQ